MYIDLISKESVKFHCVDQTTKTSHKSSSSVWILIDISLWTSLLFVYKHMAS